MKPETVQLLKNIAFGIGILSLTALVLWGAWHIVRLPSLTISQVVVAGGETISHESIQVETEQLLEGEYWGFIPRRFVYLYPQQEIVELLEATPRVKNPTVERHRKTIMVSLAEFEPAALWCDVSSTTPCVFLDENGYGFAAAPALSGGAFTRFIRVGKTATTSAVYADQNDFMQLKELERLLADIGWLVSRIEFDDARDVFIYFNEGGELKVTLQLTPEKTLENLQAVLTAEEYSHLQPGNFEYIDLRFGNKVFVNEFGAEPLIETEEATTTVESLEEIE